jgi:hypothetical protein
VDDATFFTEREKKMENTQIIPIEKLYALRYSSTPNTMPTSERVRRANSDREIEEFDSVSGEFQIVIDLNHFRRVYKK